MPLFVAVASALHGWTAWASCSQGDATSRFEGQAICGVMDWRFPSYSVVSLMDEEYVAMGIRFGEGFDMGIDGEG